MLDETLSPGVLWGQHRTSELIAMGVKERLENDSGIAKSIPFVEFERYNLDDYIELLHRQKEAAKSGVSADEFEEYLRTRVRPETLAYEDSLREQHGPFLFNLHDGNKYQHVDYDIEFRIPNHIKDDKKLGTYLEQVAERHGLKLKLEYFHPTSSTLFEINSPNSVIVEFMTPEAEISLDYHSDEIRELVERFKREFLKTKIEDKYKVLDCTSQLYLQTVDRYTDFMKDVLLGK